MSNPSWEAFKRLVPSDTDIHGLLAYALFESYKFSVVATTEKNDGVLLNALAIDRIASGMASDAIFKMVAELADKMVNAAVNAKDENTIKLIRQDIEATAIGSILEEMESLSTAIPDNLTKHTETQILVKEKHTETQILIKDKHAETEKVVKDIDRFWGKLGFDIFSGVITTVLGIIVTGLLVVGLKKGELLSTDETGYHLNLWGDETKKETTPKPAEVDHPTPPLTSPKTGLKARP